MTCNALQHSVTIGKFDVGTERQERSPIHHVQINSAIIRTRNLGSAVAHTVPDVWLQRNPRSHSRMFALVEMLERKFCKVILKRTYVIP